MLLEFMVENFRSIKDPLGFSMIASSDKTHLETNTRAIPGSKHLRVVTSAVIYGPNASGKSNLISAMNCLENLVRRSATKMQTGDEIKIDPYLLDDESVNKPTKFETIFVQDGIKYHFGLSVTKKMIIEEWLMAYPKGKPQTWYERKYDPTTKSTVFEFKSALKGENKTIEKFVRPNSLFLSHAAQNSHQQLSPVFEWFNSKFKRLVSTNRAGFYTAKKCAEDKDFCSLVAELMKGADTGIDDVLIEETELDQAVLDKLPEEIREKLNDDTAKGKAFQVKTVHKKETGGVIDFDFAKESDGTRRIFEFAGPWLDVLYNGKVLFIDELDRSLHPALTKYLLTMFSNPKFNKKDAQIICTTHDVSLLDQKVMRRDQVWLMEKTGSASTLTPLTDYSPRKDESLLKGYLLGRYGAVPFIEQEFLNVN